MLDAMAKLDEGYKQELNRRTAWLLEAYSFVPPAEREYLLRQLPRLVLEDLISMAKRDKLTLDNKDQHTSADILYGSRLNAFIRVVEDVLKERKYGG